MNLIDNKNEIYYIYVLENRDSNKSYVGCTNNLDRRLKQHNKILSGGAKYTTSLNGGWNFIFYISGFPDKYDALSAEWKMKNIQRLNKYRGVKGRLESLIEFTYLNRWTSKCLIDNYDLIYQISIQSKYYDLIKDKLNSNFIIDIIN